MKSPLTRGRRSGAGIVGFLRPGWRRGGIGRLAALAGLLLLPLHVGAQGAGDLDTSFGNTGVVLTDVVQNQAVTSFRAANAVALQSDGKIVVAGEVHISSPPSTDFALLRYLPNGKLDKTFAGTGQVIADFGRNNSDNVNAVAVQPDGKIVVAGTASAPDDDEPTHSTLALVRYKANGALDTAFGGDG